MSEGYYKTKESVDEYIRLADGHNGALLIDKLKNFLPVNSHLLEIGTGPGTDWRILSSYYKVIGSDNSMEFLYRLILNDPNAEFLKLDAATLRTNRKFDGIYSNKVLHHLSDDELKDSIKRQYEISNPSGIICHSFWKGEGSEVYKGLFVNYHSDRTIKSFFGRWFEVLLMEEYKEFDPQDSILLIGKKKD